MSLETLKTKVGLLIEKAQSGGGDTKDNPLQYATFADGCIFKGAQFPENYKIEFGIAVVNSSTVQRSFLSSNITEITITTPLGSFLLSFCQGCGMLKVVTFTNGSGILEGNWSSAFNGCKELETINGEIDFSNVTNLGNILLGCYKLKDITIKPNSLKLSFFIPSPVLSAESIQSIIDGLATVETAQTLTLHADVKAKLTEEQLATITNKNWNLA